MSPSSHRLSQGTLALAATSPQLSMSTGQLNNESRHQVQLQMRRERRAQNNIDYKALAVAHAVGEPTPRLVCLTTPTGEPRNQRSQWHTVVRMIARRRMDWSIREFRKAPDQFKWAINAIEVELDDMFNFNPVPVRRDVLERYVQTFMNNDRFKWHRFWENHGQQKHPDMPDKAWPILDTWWRSQNLKRE